MGYIGIQTINTAISNYLISVNNGIAQLRQARIQDAAEGELTETIADTPAFQVYPQSGSLEPLTNQSPQTTMQKGVQQSVLVYFVDLYAVQRANIGEDMQILIPWIDRTYTLLETAPSPYFGIDAIQGYNFRYDRIVFRYGEPAQNYVGGRFTITTRIF